MKKLFRFMMPIIIASLICLVLTGCKAKEKIFHIGVLQWTEKVDAFQKTYKGIIDGLVDKGLREGVNLKINYQNAGQDKRLALKIARGFVKERVDLIVAVGTGSSLAALKATEKNRIPIVFSNSAAPKAVGIIKDFGDSGRNITGISMKVPTREQFKMVKAVIPGLKRLGILYCTDMPTAVINGEEAASIAPEFGWSQLTVSLPKKELPQLERHVQSLARKVDAIYITTDPILELDKYRPTVIRICDEHKIPLITIAKKFVEYGSLMAVHCDFYEIGRQAADPIVQILGGVKVRTIPSQKPIIKRLSLNLKKAQQLNIKIKRNVILRADNIFD